MEFIPHFAYVHTVECQDGDVRLVNGSGLFNGRLELCLNGAWGTVCSHQFNGPDAVVVCRSLGYSRFRKDVLAQVEYPVLAVLLRFTLPNSLQLSTIFHCFLLYNYAGAFFLRRATFPPGDGPIHIANLTCTGREGSLLDCPYSNVTTTCTHAMDVDVGCRQERA